VVVANVTLFCGVEVGEPNLLIKLFLVGRCKFNTRAWYVSRE
jgi:hypothetical protein